MRQGVITKAENSDVFDIPAFIAKSKGSHSPSAKDSNEKATPSTPSVAKEEDLHANFKALDETLVAGYVESHPQLVTILGGTSADWSVKEVGDGNLNFVYILQGPKGSFVLKQVMKAYALMTHLLVSSLLEVGFGLFLSLFSKAGFTVTGSSICPLCW